jgi:outer membrane protein OmpA-like peptidoglycan-associated protein
MKQVLVRLTVLWVLLAPALAGAQQQGFFIDRYDVSERGSDWFVGDSLDLRGNARPALGLVLDYAYRPLVLYGTNGERRASIVRNQLFGHLGASFVFADRVRLALNVPVAFVTEGRSARLDGTLLAAKSGPHLGDLRFSADVKLAGEYGGPGTLAIGAQLYLPSGNTDAFTGDGKVRFVPHLLFAGQQGIFEYSARVALDFRKHIELAGVPHGSEVAFALTAGVSALDRLLLIGPELWGSTTTVDDTAFERATTPLELLFGVHVRPKDFRAGFAVGPGLTRGRGSPEVRLLAMFEWAPEEVLDRDGDDVLDVDDACPDVPGDHSSDPSRNGCPLVSDSDLDGVPDGQDACPTVPGVASTDPAKHGCPVAGDRDGDGVIDRDDDCPDVRGVASAVPGQNGCPPDHDGDGILDQLDACPTLAGLTDPDPTKNGCPLAFIERDQIVINKRIEFAFDSANLLPESYPVLAAVASVLREHREIGVLLVEGHTDEIGTAAYNKQLSQRRAASVRAWLIKDGIELARLLDAGFGRERPIDTNSTADGRQRNRRVEFHIIERNGERLDTRGKEVP